MASEATRFRLARAMEELMHTRTLESITVTELCARCGVTRQTFYRNFLDKYDLVNWYFGKLLTRSFARGAGAEVRVYKGREGVFHGRVPGGRHEFA